MKRALLLWLMAAILTASGSAAADDARHGQAGEDVRSATGVILSVSHATGDMLIYQDSGSVIALYGFARPRLTEIGAGDRVAVTFSTDLQVLKIEKTAFTSIRYE